MRPYPFFEVTPPGAAPGPPVKTGARVCRFRGCNHAQRPRFIEFIVYLNQGRYRRFGLFEATS